MELTGLDGSNPLGFLAALGVLRMLQLKSPEILPTLCWSPSFHAKLQIQADISANAVSEILVKALKQITKEGVCQFGDIIGVSQRDFADFIEGALDQASEEQGRNRLLFASAFGSPAMVDSKKGTIVPTAISFTNGQGTKRLLKDFRTLIAQLTVNQMYAALFEPWKYEDCKIPIFRWDPSDMRMGAHMATDPGDTEIRSVAAANALAFAGMSYLAVVPDGDGLLTTGFRRVGKDLLWAWPLWEPAINSDSVASLLQQQHWSKQAGTIACFGAKRLMFKKNLYFSNAIAMDGSFLRS
jgi:hypothetical protein